MGMLTVSKINICTLHASCSPLRNNADDNSFTDAIIAASADMSTLLSMLCMCTLRTVSLLAGAASELCAGAFSKASHRKRRGPRHHCR